MLTLQSFQTSYWFIRLHSNRNSTFLLLSIYFQVKKEIATITKVIKKSQSQQYNLPKSSFFFFLFTYINKQSMKPRASAMQDSSILNEEDKFWLKTAWTKNNVLGKQVEKT